MTRPEFQLDEVVPHSSTMSLLDEIVDYGPDWLQSRVLIHADSVFVTDLGVPGWIGLEYMAQTVAAYAGVQERLQGGAPKIGFLVGTRRYECSQPYFSIGATLRIDVREEFRAENGLGVFSCTLSAEGVQASASINVFQPDDSAQFLGEPKS